ncbi:MAG: MBL fold metallo-hydrolase [Clostridiales bacterium]|nr:MBL fold metallo-hydrolase [Clostridiales bacterium]
MAENTFRAKKLLEDTWVIYIGNTTAYLIAGDDEGMMIDSGNTPGELRKFCESVCGKPVRKVANTHGHFDHTGGNGYFEVAYMGALAAKICRVPNGPSSAAVFDQLPMDYDIVIVGDGDKIDLGNREIEVFVLDGHSPDSTAYLDKKVRVLFVGDNLGMAPMKYKCADPQPSMLRFAMNLCKVMARRDEYDYILQGHNDKLVDADAVNYGLICALRAADGACDPMPPRPPRLVGEQPKMGKPPYSNPEYDGYVEYKTIHLSFDKRYARDLTEYGIIEGT